jgi:hypothetical protein
VARKQSWAYAERRTTRWAHYTRPDYLAALGAARDAASRREQPLRRSPAERSVRFLRGGRGRERDENEGHEEDMAYRVGSLRRSRAIALRGTPTCYGFTTTTPAEPRVSYACKNFIRRACVCARLCRERQVDELQPLQKRKKGRNRQTW